VLVEYELLSSTSRRVVERNLLSMSHQTLVGSPADTKFTLLVSVTVTVTVTANPPR
jgi:hypothetical protein